MTNVFQIATKDDSSCGITIKRTGSNGFALGHIETGGQFAVALSPDAAIVRAGEELQSYADCGNGAPDEWAATVAQGREMVENFQDYTVYLDDLDEVE